MNANLRRFALAASLGLALPAARADLININGTVPPVMDAVQSITRELQRASDPTLSMRAQFERYETFRPTPQTAAKLLAAFGTDHPFLFERQPDQKGRSAWRATLLPLHYMSSPDAGVDWDTGVLDLTLDKPGTTLRFDGSWNRFSASDGTLHMQAEGMTLSGHQKRGYAGMWFGEGQWRTARLRVDDGKGGTLAMDDVRAGARMVEHPKSADIDYDARIGAIEVSGERVEDVHVGVRVLNVDKQVLAALKTATDKQNPQVMSIAPTPVATAQQLHAIMPVLRDFARSAQARGTVIQIDDISARYHGSQATLRGRIGLAGVKDVDLDDAKSLIQRIVARFEIKVPLAIVRDIGGKIAARQAAQQGNAAAAQMSPAQLGQSIADAVVGKLVGGGFARLEDDALVSTVEWRDGVLRANGKAVPLPAGAPGAPGAAASSSQTVAAGATTGIPARPLPPDALQARLLESGCRLPDYPDEVVRADQPLRMVMTYRVGADGKVRNAAVASPSQFPAWDQAALAVLAQCTYIPALEDGKPIEVPMVWNIRRAPGSRSPQ